MASTITILGINGGIGRHAAEAFHAAGWRVRGFGRSDRFALPGVDFIKGDADRLPDLRAAVAGADVVLNGLNLPYDQWGGGRAEALMERVIAASEGKTLLFPGNVYNYSATDRVLTPGLRQKPQTERGAIRVRMETMLAQAAGAGALQGIVLRAGDFFAPGLSGDWFETLILREAHKGKVALAPDRDIRHAWAYLPDLARAFLALAEIRASLGGFETFHFAGHFVSAAQMLAAMRKAAPRPLEPVAFPWRLLMVLGLVMPLLREVVRMRYLWEHEMELRDDRLEAILGPGFGTPLETAVARTVRPVFEAARQAA